jgi:hypothetical protein
VTWQRWDVDRADCSNGGAASKLAVLIGDAKTRRFFVRKSESFDRRGRAEEKKRERA